MDEQTHFLSLNAEIVRHNLCQLSNLVFEVTDACNLRCTYCAPIYIPDLHSSPAFPKRLNIGFYGGEPLLNINLIKEIIDYVEEQKDLGRALSYSMTTNGIWKYWNTTLCVSILKKEYHILFPAVSVDLDGFVSI